MLRLQKQVCQIFLLEYHNHTPSEDNGYNLHYI